MHEEHPVLAAGGLTLGTVRHHHRPAAGRDGRHLRRGESARRPTARPPHRRGRPGDAGRRCAVHAEGALSPRRGPVSARQQPLPSRPRAPGGQVAVVVMRRGAIRSGFGSESSRKRDGEVEGCRTDRSPTRRSAHLRAERSWPVVRPAAPARTEAYAAARAHPNASALERNSAQRHRQDPPRALVGSRRRPTVTSPSAAAADSGEAAAEHGVRAPR